MKQPGDRSRRRFLKASSMLGLAVAFRPRTTGEAFADSQFKTIQKEDTMTQSSATQRAAHGLIREATCLSTNDGNSPANALWIGGFARLPGSLAL